MADENIVFYLLIFVLAFFVTAVSVRSLIPKLRKSAEQPIYEEGPIWHLKKQGTPTMGGIGFVIALTVSFLISALYLFAKQEYYFATSLLLTLLFALSNALIGIIDDYAKIRKKENAGLTPIQKLLLQAIVATIFLIARRLILLTSTTIFFSFGTIELGIFYYPIALIMLLGTVNSANLTDGVDGIASGVAFAIGISLAFLSSGANYEVEFIAFTVMGIAVAFLIFNLHPAKIFMGDTGSLLFGSLVAAACTSLGNPLIILFVGGVYLVESLSVILQVVFFKFTKKRLFKMAPFHHHLEKCGWAENKIVIWAIIMTLVFSLPAIFLFV